MKGGPSCENNDISLGGKQSNSLASTGWDGYNQAPTTFHRLTQPVPGRFQNARNLPEVPPRISPELVREYPLNLAAKYHTQDAYTGKFDEKEQDHLFSTPRRNTNPAGSHGCFSTVPHPNEPPGFGNSSRVNSGRQQMDIKLPLPYKAERYDNVKALQTFCTTEHDLFSYNMPSPRFGNGLSTYAQDPNQSQFGRNRRGMQPEQAPPKAPIDGAVLFSVQTFKCKMSRSLLVYTVPQTLQEGDLLSLFSSYGKVECLYTARKKDLGVIVVAYADFCEAKEAMEKLSSEAFPVEVQYCVNVVPDKPVNCQGVKGYFDENRVMVTTTRDSEMIFKIFTQFGKIHTIEQNIGGVVVEFTSIVSRDNCLRKYSGEDTSERIKCIPIPLAKTQVRLGQSLYSFIKGSIKIPGNAMSPETNSMQTTSSPANDRQSASPISSSRAAGLDPDAPTFHPIATDFHNTPAATSPTSHTRQPGKVNPTGSHPHHQHLKAKKASLSHHPSPGFVVDISKVTRGIDIRTSVMIRNIPNKYSQGMLLDELDQHVPKLYDFFYLPIDFKNKCNVGYAFLNVVTPKAISTLCAAFNNKRWQKFNSDKVCAISYAKVQGKENLANRFRNSSLMQRDADCRPLVFYSSGPLRGMPEEFPQSSIGSPNKS